MYTTEQFKKQLTQDLTVLCSMESLKGLEVPEEVNMMDATTCIFGVIAEHLGYEYADRAVKRKLYNEGVGYLSNHALYKVETTHFDTQYLSLPLLEAIGYHDFINKGLYKDILQDISDNNLQRIPEYVERLVQVIPDHIKNNN